VIFGMVFGMHHQLGGSTEDDMNKMSVFGHFFQLYFDHNKNLWAPQTCVCYAPAKCGKFDVSLCFFQFCYRYLEI
jgi:hypothetical protein